MIRPRQLIPLAAALLLLLMLGLALGRNPRELPSPLIGRPVPAFSLPRLDRPEARVADADLRGKVWLLNVWASWCVSCREEHAVLLTLAEELRGVATLRGLNYKDARDDGMRWLSQFGNPYESSAFDHDGRVGIEFGVYGVPETFVIDRRGIIRYKQTGILTAANVRDTIVPLVRQLQEER